MFATRGIHASMNQMIQDLNAQRFWWRRLNLTPGHAHEGIVEDTPIQGSLRPIQLWEYVYPETSPKEPGNINSEMIDNTQVMLKSFDLKNKDHYEPKRIGKYVRFAGKMAGLDPIPEAKPEGPYRFIHLPGISIIPIGVKKDEYKIHDFGEAGKYEQEM